MNSGSCLFCLSHKTEKSLHQKNPKKCLTIQIRYIIMNEIKEVFGYIFMYLAEVIPITLFFC